MDEAVEEVMPRAKSPRYPDFHGKIYQSEESKAKSSARMKALYADPVWRAERIAACEAGKAAAKAKGKVMHRYGVPDGMRKEQAKWFWRQAKFEATLTMKKLEKAGVVPNAADATPDDVAAKEALHEAITVMRGPNTQQIKLQAAKLVLEYTKAKPAQKQEVTLNKAEEWLAAVTADNAQEADEGATPSA